MKKGVKLLLTAALFLTAFAIWTVLVCFIDVQAIGPEGSVVGFARMNGWVNKLIGVNMRLYIITDWLGLVPLAVVIAFGVTGLIQWIKGKHLLLVDHSILVLGIFYIVVMAVFLLFEEVVINYRPVLIQGVLEASYPSSTTLLVMCVMPTAAMQLYRRMKSGVIQRVVILSIWTFVGFMVMGRLLAGVHWLSDIFAGVLISAGLVLLYAGVCDLIEVEEKCNQ